MADARSTGLLAGPGIMLLSAAIFGFFGFFYVNWNTPGVNGQTVPFRVLCGWTLKVSAVAYVICAVLTLAKPIVGNILYSIVGLVCAVLLVIVVILDVMDQQHGIMAYGPVILSFFAIWNGYGAWTGLKGALAARQLTQYDRPAGVD